MSRHWFLDLWPLASAVQLVVACLVLLLSVVRNVKGHSPLRIPITSPVKLVFLLRGSGVAAVVSSPVCMGVAASAP